MFVACVCECLSSFLFQIANVAGKGRGILATIPFKKGDFVVEYVGDLLTEEEARAREQVHKANPNAGCFMYYFKDQGKKHCLDATKETHHLGRLLNHSRLKPNCETKVFNYRGTPHLIILAARDIAPGEELLYDYGDLSKSSLQSHPWLAE